MMGSAASTNSPQSSPKTVRNIVSRRGSTLRPTGLAKPIVACAMTSFAVVMTKNNRSSHLVRTNEVAPVIIKNCNEEYQQMVDLTEPIIYGRLRENMIEHPFIMGKCILVRDNNLCDDLLNTTEQFLAPNVRQAGDDYPVFGMGQATKGGLDLIIESLQKRNYTWITLFNLRRESVFFIKHDYDMVPYSLRDVEKLNEVFVNSVPGIDAAEEEVRMRKEILDFATLKDDNKFFFYTNLSDAENEPHVFPLQFEDNIPLLEEVYSRKAFSSPFIGYKRIPFPAYGPPTAYDIDHLLNMYKEYPAAFTPSDEKHAAVFTCHTGVGPSTLGMVMVCLLEAHRNGFPHDKKSLNDSKHEGSETQTDENGEFCAIVKLIEVLPDGLRLKQQVDAMIDLCGQLHNVRTVIGDTKKLIEGITNDYTIEGISARQYLHKRCLSYLDSYFMLICFNCYLTEQFRERFIMSYTVWLRRHPHIARLHSHLDMSHVSAPCSLVLNGAVKLVSDEYIGLDVLSSQMDVRVSNFRRVLGFPLYGMAQPNRDGLSRVVTHLMNKKQRHPVVLLINLRNDVCLDCDGVTYNIRDANNLAHSLDLSGVTTNDIEMKEEQMKGCISQSTDSFLVYEDIADPAKVKDFRSVLSMRDLSDIQHEKTAQFAYRRIPICGDAAPTEKTFDSLLQLLNNLPEITSDEDGPALVFSCRTGKSRTTTAMSIACLYISHKRGFQYGAKLGEQERVSVPNAKYTKGDYLIVQSLVRVIPNGQQVKREVDFILDKCFETMTPMHFHMREVIFVTYNKIKNAKTPEEEMSLKLRSLMYLERYLYLILFNAYLHAERKSNWSERLFSTWMTEVAAKSGVYDILDNLSFSDFGTAPCGLETMMDRWSKHAQSHNFRGELI